MPEKAVFQNVKILYIDNHPAPIWPFDRLLKDTGCMFQAVKDEVSALQTAQKIIPDLYIVNPDVSISTDIESFYQTIRNHSALKNGIIFEIIPSETETGSLATSTSRTRVGVDGRLSASLGNHELIERIGDVFQKKTLETENANLIKKNKVLLQTLTRLEDERDGQRKALQTKDDVLAHSLKQVALLIEEREFIQKNFERLNQIQQDGLHELVDLLVGVIKAKQKDHPRHSENVAGIALFLAQALNIAEDAVWIVETAALLHEIGKLYIADDLLAKQPAKRSPLEIELCLRHPLRGADILEKFTGMKPVAHVLRHLHEYPDGSGIPEGLSGKNIPIESRIIAAASFFDKFIFYHHEQPLKTVLGIMENKSGVRFDAGVVRGLHQYVTAHPLEDAYHTREISLWELIPGMVLAKGIYSLNGAKLIPLGTVLTETMIRHLMKYNEEDPLEATMFIKR